MAEENNEMLNQNNENTVEEEQAVAADVTETQSPADTAETGDVTANRWQYSPEDQERSKKERASLGRKGALTFVLVVALVFALCAGLLVASFFINPRRGSSSTGTNVNLGVTVSETVNPSIVFIKAVNSLGYSTGSGVVYSSDGYVVTNYHIIEDATSIRVTLYTGESFNAKLVGCVVAQDIAVIKVETTGLKRAVFGDSSALSVGETVFAIGHPAGISFGWSISQGIISGLDRSVLTSSGHPVSVIQTDCSVNTGNSGGALVNANCEVIGIVSMRLGTEYEGIGFALPINEVGVLIEKIMGGYNDADKEAALVNRPYIGITGVGVTAGSYYTASADGSVRVVDENTEGAFKADVTGVWVVSVPAGGAAYGKLRADDIILKVEDTEVTTVEMMMSIFSKHVPGDEVKVEYYRDGSVQEVTIVLKANTVS